MSKKLFIRITPKKQRVLRKIKEMGTFSFSEISDCLKDDVSMTYLSQLFGCLIKIKFIKKINDYRNYAPPKHAKQIYAVGDRFHIPLKNQIFPIQD